MKRTLLFFLLISSYTLAQEYDYKWLGTDCTEKRIKDTDVPEGYHRKIYHKNTFQSWLQHLPLKQNNEYVFLYNGEKKINQNAHFKIINIDVGKNDLQQCADAIIRLYAEYLYGDSSYSKIHFNFTSGDTVYFIKWGEGYRPIIHNNHVKWVKKSTPNFEYKNFRQYLNTVFTYAGSYSLSKELIDINANQMEVGDIFIQGGFPGHAVIVVDLAKNKNDEIIFLLAQSYMPAQEIHILRNPNNSILDPWYKLDDSHELRTPEWIFKWSNLKRFDY